MPRSSADHMLAAGLSQCSTDVFALRPESSSRLLPPPPPPLVLFDVCRCVFLTGGVSGRGWEEGGGGGGRMQAEHECASKLPPSPPHRGGGGWLAWLAGWRAAASIHHHRHPHISTKCTAGFCPLALTTEIPSNLGQMPPGVSPPTPHPRSPPASRLPPASADVSCSLPACGSISGHQLMVLMMM